MVSISIVIPAYNEQNRLPASLTLILAYLAQRSFRAFEVIVVNDGSGDATAQVVRQAAARDPNVRLLENPGNRGKGYAVRHGMLAAQNDWVLFSDADLSTPIDELDRLLCAAEAGQADVVIGARTDDSLITVHQSRFREASGRIFNFIMRTVVGLRFHDTQCGFKLYRREAAQAIFQRQSLDGFSFDVEDLCIAQQLGVRIVDVPVRWSNAEGTKVGMMQGVKSFWDLIVIGWNRLCGRYR